MSDDIVLDDSELNKPYDLPPDMLEEIRARMAKGESYESALEAVLKAVEAEDSQPEAK